MSYSHLTITERGLIAQYLRNGLKIRRIAELLERSPSTISREIKRNSRTTVGPGRCSTRYFPVQADKRYQRRRENCHRKSIICETVSTYIQQKIDVHWSPEQIAKRTLDAPCKLPSFSTIYRWIHKKHLKNASMKQLRRKGKFSRPAEKRGKFNDGGRTLKKRPKEVYYRRVVGHWEVDTVESGRVGHTQKSKTCFVTLAERVSRYYIAIPVPNRTEKVVTAAILKTLGSFPKEGVKTLTFDRGKEFAGYEAIEQKLGCQTYFCDPYCAWQKGTNENSNGLLREFYPKGMDLSLVDEEDVRYKVKLMNDRPRKCLNFQTPKEVFMRHLQNCCT